MSRAVAATSGQRAAPALVGLLDGVLAWRAQTSDEIESSLATIAEEERTIRRRMDEAQRQYTALTSLRHEQEERRLSLDEETIRRKRIRVREALEIDRALLAERAGALHARVTRRDLELGAGLDAPDMIEAVTEYLDAQERAAALRGGLVAAPEELISAHARARLEPYLRAASSPPPSLGLPAAAVGVVVSVDPPEGRPEALLLVLPVPWAVYGEATVREEDLCSLLAYRIVAAIQTVLADVGAPDALVRFDELQGNLAVQVWLGDTLVAPDLRERVLECVATAVEGARELQAAAVEVCAVWLTPDLLAEASS
ncbi:MAG: hypothetical protein Q8P41_24030 [Pseudomonadota bacterium]|nr:hypothetical protein [Pseudomonadota bacterium]